MYTGIAMKQNFDDVELDEFADEIEGWIITEVEEHWL